MKININTNYKNLGESYLFSEVGKRSRAYSAANPDKRVIRLGIGDVTLPLSEVVIEAMQSAVAEMGCQSTFRGYAPEYGYDFLREAVAAHYEGFGVKLNPSEIFVSDGAKSDVGNIVEIFGDNQVIIPDPVYPVYLDSNVMAGRRISFIRGSTGNSFLPMPEELTGEGYVIYICSPNNPTGAVYDKERLSEWVRFALETGSLIIFDSAYEAFVTDGSPRSIFEIDGARECAIEICSLSKTAGFTGTRCAWTVIPTELCADGMSINKLWSRRQATKFNGVPYIVQRGAEAALSERGMAECKSAIDYYMANARAIADLMDEKGIFNTGGKSSPYIWLKCPRNMGSWEFFDYLLENAQVVGTPGEGFGEAGRGFFRLTAFGSHENTAEAVERLRALL